MSNRVEELESKVAELQAAVNGLTEELVETKERLRQLEDANDVEVPSRAPRRRGDWTPAEEAAPEDAETADPVDGDETKPDEADDSDEEESQSPDDDIIVA
ncbi:chromosome segregation protein SMC [Haloferax sp. MBLA0076]|uniref:Chromosome segregation protein SMC n=1 Tax=Haloferax litoreum TaxID=2666140 RepID=A0A6A8GCC9_9EURY|nr:MULTISPECIES: chromosome segregation protein SMC [Haloferax]KAB1192258.1 chromosome segregation protein SMC [Haloferax sp. CBA1148]MRX20715.1 chromosome segregation protein SMC [Haloferax litoreum]